MCNSTEINQFIEEFRVKFDKFLECGEFEEAKEINRNIEGGEKHKLKYKNAPAPFFGDLNSEYVVVNLNPGISKDEGETKESLSKKGIIDFDGYYDYLINFGNYRYGNPKSIPDKFDVKMVGCLIPFDKLDKQFGFQIKNTKNETHSNLDNLVKVVQNKCQLEFIGYGSSEFNKKNFLKDPNSYKRMERLLDIIFSVHRKRVFFNGAIFYDLLKNMQDENIILEDKKRYCLTKENGSTSVKTYSYVICNIKRGEQNIRCIINIAFADRSFFGSIMREELSEIIIKNEFSSESK